MRCLHLEPRSPARRTGTGASAPVTQKMEGAGPLRAGRWAALQTQAVWGQQRQAAAHVQGPHPTSVSPGPSTSGWAAAYCSSAYASSPAQRSKGHTPLLGASSGLRAAEKGTQAGDGGYECGELAERPPLPHRRETGGPGSNCRRGRRAAGRTLAPPPCPCSPAATAPCPCRLRSTQRTGGGEGQDHWERPHATSK